MYDKSDLKTSKRWLKILIAIVVSLVVLSTIIYLCLRVRHIKQDVLAFKYNALSGKPISEGENGIMKFGYHFRGGWHDRIFKVSSQNILYDFTYQQTDTSPFEEALSVDTSEGITVEMDHSISISAQNPWKFFQSFGEDEQYACPKNYEFIKDWRMYQTVRIAEGFLNKRVPEISEKISVADIRNRALSNDPAVLKDLRAYMEQFGIGVNSLIFMSNLTFPTAPNLINKIDELGNIGGTINEKIKQEGSKTADKEKNVTEAQTEAQSTISTARQEADTIISQGNEVREQLQKLVKQTGDIDKAIQLFLIQKKAALIANGKITKSILSEQSLGWTPPTK